MKRLTFILLISITFIAAKCQNPDTLTYYSTAYVDSISNNYQAQFNNQSNTIDSLLSELHTHSDTIHADTFNFLIIDGRIKVDVQKNGHNIWVLIEDGPKRLNLDYIDYKRRIILADSLKTTGSWYPD